MPRGENELRLTQTGMVMGTAYYMSPEQARGASDVDHRSDIWSVGVILYQMLAGVRPYRGHSYNALMFAIASEPVPPLAMAWPDIDQNIAGFVERALSKEVNGRYTSADEMLLALDVVAANMEEVGLGDTRISMGPGPMNDQKASSPIESTRPSPQLSPQVQTDLSEPETSSSQMHFAGFWRRGLALMIDSIIFILLIASPLDFLFADGSSSKLKIVPGPRSAVVDGEAPTSDTDTATDASSESFVQTPTIATRTRNSKTGVNISDKGLQIRGKAGDEVLFDEHGLRIRSNSGEEVLVNAEGVKVREADGSYSKREGTHVNYGSSDDDGVRALKTSLWILYCALFLTFFGATPGKMVLRIRVTQMGQVSVRLPVMTALVRSTFFVFSALILALGFVASLFDKQNRTWHDRIARTVVIYEPEPS